MAASLGMSSSSSHSTSSASTSTSNTSVSENTTSGSSTDSTMGTPNKANCASMNVSHMSEMKKELKIELKGHVYAPISVTDFVKNVWGLDATILETILKAQWTLKEDAMKRYEDVYLDITCTQPEPKLHQPFREISIALLQDICTALGLNYSVAVKDDFWDGNGSKYIHSRFKNSRRKPDLLRGWTPFLEVAIQWAEAKSALEFKLTMARRRAARIAKGLEAPEPKTPEKKKKKNLPSIPEEGDDSNADASASVVSKSRRTRASSHRSGKASATNSNASHSSAIQSSSTTQSNSTAGSTSTAQSQSTVVNSSTSSKRTISQVDGASESSESKRAKVLVTGDELQLASYALECLGDSSRHFTTGISVDGTTMTLWCYDRSAVIRTVEFDFSSVEDKGPQLLAASLFALSQANMKQAGFDPFIHEFVKPTDGQPVLESHIVPLDRPKLESGNPSFCFRFTKVTVQAGKVSTQEIIFLVTGVLSTYRAIIGRGTYVAGGMIVQIGTALSDILYIIKLSWQYAIRQEEAELIKRVRGRLPDYWQQFLPEVHFNALYSSEELGLPRSQLKELLSMPEEGEEPIQDRGLNVLVSRLYRNIINASSIEEFKTIFLDCLECHYHTYTTGRVLHRDISENNLMFAHPKDFGKSTTSIIRGILNDFDLASEVDDDGFVPRTNAHHRTGTQPFMAKDLLLPPHKSSTPPIHCYRHDLESFFYFLIWACTQYTFKTDKKGSRRGPIPHCLKKWDKKETAYMAKTTFYLDHGFRIVGDAILPHFEGVWKEWVTPLYHKVFRPALVFPPTEGDPGYQEYDFVTCNGIVTF
ncbi:hypothetical protein NLJ89_g7215 [Agrocybe chaxingu]|uniref:Protein kinase domain-containing protein n=1 Tax=Agrocybe chaxingu TaxID=84603 RepID=A0A9W8JZI3_9AGAR|nr:hypothetical protein NLJ89_g7215 [Agrocybe chaxingu]